MTNEEMFARMRVEDYFHGKIWRHYGMDIFHGTTDCNERRDRIRKFILGGKLEDRYINPKARDASERETWRAVFERGYGEKL